MTMHIYFAYGSNLGEDQMRRRCPGALAGERAELAGHRLGFRGRSRLRGGGVATVVPDVAKSVKGLLWAVGDADLAALDKCEGHPTVYERVRQAVVDVRGQQVEAWIYVRRRDADRVTAPAPSYVEAIRAGYRRLGFDQAAIEAALVEAGASEGGAGRASPRNSAV